MKRRELERHLRTHGCEFLEHGARHDTWINRQKETLASVPRQAEIKFGTAKAICRELGIPAIRTK